jgi:glutamine cyclotransferase
MSLIGGLVFLMTQYAGTRIATILVFTFALAGMTCQSGTVANRSEAVSRYGYEVINTWPHDTGAYTQGLLFHDGQLIESTGQQGRSSLRRVELNTGNILQRVGVPAPYFAEGLTLFKGKLFQLTWEHQRGFIYDPATFDKTGEFSYSGEGWGLTNDGESLILSDGTNRLRFLDPNTFQVKRTISVRDGSKAITDLNELEYVHGEVYANVWHSNSIARIDPQSGRVIGWIDLSSLLKPGEVSNEEAVLNGIAWDEAGDRIFVTGKLWPKLFEIQLKRK